MDLSYLILLGITVSIDGFFAGMAYGIKKIKIPFSSLLVIGFVTLICTTIAVIAAISLGQFTDAAFASLISAILLILLGIVNLLKEFISTLTEKTSNKLNITIPLGGLVINIMKKPECADIDHSLLISKSEATVLGFALGIDNMAAAFALGLSTGVPVSIPIVLSFIQMMLIFLGITFATAIAKETWQRRTTYIPGIILILMGLLRII